jgi:excisionase family DNA binding protein
MASNSTNSLVAAPESRALDLMDEGVVSIRQAEAFTSFGRTKLYELMDAGKLAYVKIDGSRRIPRKALKQLMASGLHGGDQTPA